jgi:translation initiation factor IF-3
MSSREAQSLANEAGVDLVEIVATADPPVVKLIDWGKFQYQQMKEASKAKKKAKSSEMKQIRLGLKISDNDLGIKFRKVREFLGDGDRVKITIVFRGREMAHKEIGDQLAQRVIALASEYAVVDGQPQMAGRNLSFTLRAKK